MAWTVDDQLKVINQVVAIFEEYKSKVDINPYKILNNIIFNKLKIEDEIAIDEAFKDICQYIFYYYEDLGSNKTKDSFKLKLLQIDSRLGKLTSGLYLSNNKSISSYWKMVKPLQKAINSDSKLRIPVQSKNEILAKMSESLNGENYLISKLLIYGYINEEIFINFLFYNAINTKKMFDLLINSTDQFCQKFMFNITPGELPKFERFFEISEIEQIRNQINIDHLIKRINTVSLDELKALFPKSYKHNILTNPFLKKADYYSNDEPI